MRLIVALTLVFAAAAAPACCGVAEGGRSVVFTGQTNLIVWDAKRGIEHFIRDARFETKGGGLGFIAPTPGKPTLSAVDARVFDALEALRPAEPMKSGVKDDPETTKAASSVQIVAESDVAGYHATVLKATDGEALGAWLKANGYASPAFLPKWVAPYVARGWYLTAFRVNGDATGPIRMSFPTDRPFNPYSVPKENGTGNGSLRLFFVSTGGEVPKIGGTGAWREAEWTADLPQAAASRVAHDLRLDASAMPQNARVAEYADSEFGTPGLDDLYFVPDHSSLARNAAFGAGVVFWGTRRLRRKTA